MVVVGESMGAYVAVVLAATHPELVDRLVLADGGVPLPLPESIDPNTLLDAVIGPAIRASDRCSPHERPISTSGATTRR